MSSRKIFPLLMMFGGSAWGKDIDKLLKSEKWYEKYNTPKNRAQRRKHKSKNK